MQGSRAPTGQRQGRPFCTDRPHLALHVSPAPRYSLDTCRRILLDRAVPNLLRAKHWYSPSYSSGRPPLRKSITRVPDRLRIDTRGSLATLKNLLLRVQWKLWGARGNRATRGFRLQLRLQSSTQSPNPISMPVAPSPGEGRTTREA